METGASSVAMPEIKAKGTSEGQSHKILYKALITGGLILGMFIPAVSVEGLVKERQGRQETVVHEVSKQWSNAQTLYGPFICIPYTKPKQDSSKAPETLEHLYILPEEEDVSGTMIPEVRYRSIFQVLVYHSVVHSKGSFKIKIPRDIPLDRLKWSEATVCIGLSDLKGIEEKVGMNLEGASYNLTPGLPFNLSPTFLMKDKQYPSQNSDDDEVGLSSGLTLSAKDMDKPIDFDMDLKIKGSKSLNFVPLCGNGSFSLKSSWKNPKFMGNSIPNERDVSEKGFSAKWLFNAANLPFGTVMTDFNFSKQDIAFGVEMLQPLDQYAIIMRCMNYALLFIGLTFSLFFIIELMQQKAMHPVQYILVGFALVIFFTLLLSIGEFLTFWLAYLIAASATITLIASYAGSHFKSVLSGSIFGMLLTCLYGFIFILVQLEDAALLIGSIGLFVILVLVMFGSKRINWYGELAV